ncbi:MAG: GNAT family N-acetyltransferase, partial [Bryobacteraceae bacterium]
GVAAQAVRAFLLERFAGGVEKVSAAFFANNARIERFLDKLGAEPEGYLRRQTLRDGRAVDMRLVAIFREGVS